MGAFRTAAGIAFIGILAAHLYHLFANAGPELLLGCNLLVLLGLSLVAAREQRRWGSAFSSALAAETIVAFGVLALILGLVTALVPLMFVDAATLAFDAATVRRVGLPFAQGLASAGLAPVFAVLVRIKCRYR